MRIIKRTYRKLRKISIPAILKGRPPVKIRLKGNVYTFKPRTEAIK